MSDEGTVEDDRGGRWDEARLRAIELNKHNKILFKAKKNVFSVNLQK